jgi:hypothetical protein
MQPSQEFIDQRWEELREILSLDAKVMQFYEVATGDSDAKDFTEEEGGCEDVPF